jgi:sugar lactone lactonase YvrE
MPKSGFGRVQNTPICAVGESPVWDDKLQCLFWVDIISKKIFCQSPAQKTTDCWATNDFPTAIALTDDDNVAILALAQGIATFDFATGTSNLVAQPDTMQGNRLNEGKCDSSGRFWAGSMQNNLNSDGTGRQMNRNSGALFRFDGDGTISRHTEFDFGISNTMAWSPDNRTFYFGDSTRNVIFAYDFDADQGDLSNRRILIEGYPHGAPDGSAIDADGCLWNARFGGSCLIRITPKGKIDREIPLPVTNPTSCTFGGVGKSTLFVTSATFGLTVEQLAENPHEGSLLAAEFGTVGLRDQRFQRTI